MEILFRSTIIIPWRFLFEWNGSTLNLFECRSPFDGSTTARSFSIGSPPLDRHFLRLDERTERTDCLILMERSRRCFRCFSVALEDENDRRTKWGERHFHWRIRVGWDPTRWLTDLFWSNIVRFSRREKSGSVFSVLPRWNRFHPIQTESLSWNTDWSTRTDRIEMSPRGARFPWRSRRLNSRNPRRWDSSSRTASLDLSPSIDIGNSNLPILKPTKNFISTPHLHCSTCVNDGHIPCWALLIRGEKIIVQDEPLSSG